MVTGGRILHHLRSGCPIRENTVIFIGFQAPGTRGATIKSGAAEVNMFGQTVPFEPRSPRSSSSAITPIRRNSWNGCALSLKPATTYLVHGEPAASPSFVTR